MDQFHALDYITKMGNANGISIFVKSWQKWLQKYRTPRHKYNLRKLNEHSEMILFSMEGVRSLY